MISLEYITTVNMDKKECSVKFELQTQCVNYMLNEFVSLKIIFKYNIVLMTQNRNFAYKINNSKNFAKLDIPKNI